MYECKYIFLISADRSMYIYKEIDDKSLAKLLAISVQGTLSTDCSKGPF